ncbi:MAG TPA: ABC transporter permease [Candidatus Dormibacteraeota bacterium]|nr:ABC transporter permease [Candidatus Dormibacteraeota bacterium]
MIDSERLARGAVIAAPAARAGRGFWRESWEELRSNRAGMGAAIVLCLLVAIALAAPAISGLVTHYGPTQQDLAHAFASPGRRHWLGTDELGRDTLTRLVYGARVSLGVGFLTVAIALTVGAAVGLLAGYYVGTLDDVLMRVVDVVLSVPPVFLYILMSILFRPNAITLAVIIASIGWAGLARLVRSEVLSLRTRDFIVATRSLGASDARLILHHVLPNALPVMIVAASLSLGQVVLIEAALDFLGLGIQAPTPSWGDMLSNAQVYFVHSVWLVVLPGCLIFLTVLAANVLGNAIRDAFDPRLRRA